MVALDKLTQGRGGGDASCDQQPLGVHDAVPFEQQQSS